MFLCWQYQERKAFKIRLLKFLPSHNSTGFANWSNWKQFEHIPTKDQFVKLSVSRSLTHFPSHSNSVCWSNSQLEAAQSNMFLISCGSVSMCVTPQIFNNPLPRRHVAQVSIFSVQQTQRANYDLPVVRGKSVWQSPIASLGGHYCHDSLLLQKSSSESSTTCTHLLN